MMERLPLNDEPGISIRALHAFIACVCVLLLAVAAERVAAALVLVKGL